MTNDRFDFSTNTVLGLISR